MPSFKQSLTILRQAAIIILITFILSEVTFRIYNTINPSFIFYDKLYNRFRGKPLAPDYGDFHLNSKGFKDVEFNLEKTPGTFRILGLGDSFAFGVVPYKHNYLTLLEDHLKQKGKKVELINMGLIGLAPVDYLSILVNEGLQTNPDMVLVSFFIGNDFEENKLIEQKYGRPLYTYSYVASFIKFLIDLQSKVDGQIFNPVNTQYFDNKPTFTDEHYLEIETGRTWVYTKPTKEFYQNFYDALGDLIKIKQICDHKKINLTIVIIPDEMQVNPALQAKVIKAMNVSADSFDFQQPNRLLAEEFKKNNINYIDLLDDLKSASTQTPVYKLNDSHWNIAGNKAAAEIIEKRLLEQLP